MSEPIKPKASLEEHAAEQQKKAERVKTDAQGHPIRPERFGSDDPVFDGDTATI